MFTSGSENQLIDPVLCKLPRAHKATVPLQQAATSGLALVGNLALVIHNPVDLCPGSQPIGRSGKGVLW